jgi:ketosteroid isomerase-like protein
MQCQRVALFNRSHPFQARRFNIDRAAARRLSGNGGQRELGTSLPQAQLAAFLAFVAIFAAAILGAAPRMFVDSADRSRACHWLPMQPRSPLRRRSQMPTTRMHSAVRVAAVVALLSPITATPLLAQCSQAEKVALEALDKSWGDATVSGDRTRIASFLADNYVGINIGSTLDKQATIANAERAAQLNKANPAPPAVPDHYAISCTPLTATITHRNTVIDPATKQPTYSRSVHFLEKQGSAWKAVSNAGHALSDQQQLLYMEQDWNDATVRHDGDWTERNYAPFASDISSRTGGIETKAEAVASARSSKIVYDAVELSDLAVRVEGEAGVVTGVNHVRGKDEQGKAFDRRVRFTDTFIKRDGRWQVWATQGTPIQ